jgi:hypothetical protein
VILRLQIEARRGTKSVAFSALNVNKKAPPDFGGAELAFSDASQLETEPQPRRRQRIQPGPQLSLFRDVSTDTPGSE